MVRGIPESFGKLAEGGEGLQTDLAKAQRQMGVLTGALRQKVGAAADRDPSRLGAARELADRRRWL